jgi:hypothetical protein
MLVDDINRASLQLFEPQRPLLLDALAIVLKASNSEIKRGILGRVHQPDGNWPDPIRGLGTSGITDPQEAWRALVDGGLLPATWLSSAHRSFRSQRRSRPSHRNRVADELTVFPPTVAGAVAFASDPEGVARAEMRAHQAATRLHALDIGPISETIIWRVDSRPSVNAATTRPTAFWSLRSSLPPIETLGGISKTRTLDMDAAAWTRGCIEGLVFNGASPNGGRLFRDLDDPYEPLVDIWHSGYALDEIGAALTLVIGEIGASPV